jgi:hypothetical protein
MSAALRTSRVTPQRAARLCAAAFAAFAGLAGCAAEDGLDLAPVTSPDDPRAGDGPVDGDPNATGQAIEEVAPRCTARPASVRSNTLVSWPQPDSTGWRGWNGFCGQTAAANLAANVCGVRSACPAAFDRSPCQDVTPGSRPNALACMMNRLVPGGCGHWSVVRPGAGVDPIGYLQSRVNGSAACAALVVDEDTLHWVTVTDVQRSAYACNVRFLERGGDHLLNCETFRRRWSLNDYGIVGYLLTPYALVCQTAR